MGAVLRSSSQGASNSNGGSRQATRSKNHEHHWAMTAGRIMSIRRASFHPEDARSPGLATSEQERCFGPAVRSQQQQRWRSPSDQKQESSASLGHDGRKNHEHHEGIVSPRRRQVARTGNFRARAVLRSSSQEPATATVEAQSGKEQTHKHHWAMTAGRIMSIMGTSFHPEDARSPGLATSEQEPCFGPAVRSQQQQHWRHKAARSKTHKHHWAMTAGRIMSSMGTSFHPEDARSPGLATSDTERCIGPSARRRQQQSWRSRSDQKQESSASLGHDSRKGHRFTQKTPGRPDWQLPKKERCFGPAVRSQQQQRWRPRSDEQERCFRPTVRNQQQQRSAKRPGASIMSIIGPSSHPSEAGRHPDWQHSERERCFGSTAATNNTKWHEHHLAAGCPGLVTFRAGAVFSVETNSNRGDHQETWSQNHEHHWRIVSIFSSRLPPRSSERCDS